MCARTELHSHGRLHSKINIQQNSAWKETVKHSSSGAKIRKAGQGEMQEEHEVSFVEKLTKK